MYRRLHIDHKLLSLFVICGGVLVSTSHEGFAGNDGKLTPLKVYIPNATSFISYFTTDKMEYDPDALILSAKGNVEVEQENIIVRADAVEYNQMKNMVSARGDVAILAPDGKVSFSDEIELKHEIKDGIIHRFKAQMVDNDVFMAAEAKKHVKPVENIAVAKNNKSFLDKIWAYFTPNSSVANNAVRLASLAPAAGGDVAVLEGKPVIGNVPLIVLSGEDSSVKSEVESDKLKPLEEISPPKQAEPIQPKAEEVVPTVSAPETLNNEPEVKQATTSMPKEKIEEKITKNPEIKQAKLTPKAAPKKVESKQKDKASAENKSLVEESSTEPAETLSPKSRELLDKVSPSVAPKKAKDLKPLKVNHTRDMQDLFKADEFPTTGVQNEALGIKIENKNQKINVDYELEKAYNATVSGQSEAAMGTYQNILDNAPNNTQALFGLATLYHRARQFDKARPLYGRLLTIAPQHRDGFNNFLVLLADEAPREALVELERLEEKNPGFSTIPAQIAVIYQKLGESDKAIGKMFRAVALAPENLTYRYNLAIMLDKQKNYDEAAKLYRQLVEASERGEKIPGNIANIQQRLTFISSNRP